MSLAALNWSLRDPAVQRTVFGPARAVLFVLADHASDAAEVWCSQATIVQESGFSDGAVRNALRTLEAAGVVEPLGFRQRARLRRLALPDDATSARDADVTSAGDADDAATSAPPRHDLGTTSARDADEPEPESEPRSTEKTPPASDGSVPITNSFGANPLEGLNDTATRMTHELLAALPGGKRMDGDAVADVASLAEDAELKGVTNTAALLRAAIDKRPASLLKNADMIVADAKAGRFVRAA